MENEKGKCAKVWANLCPICFEVSVHLCLVECFALDWWLEGGPKISKTSLIKIIKNNFTRGPLTFLLFLQLSADLCMNTTNYSVQFQT